MESEKKNLTSLDPGGCYRNIRKFFFTESNNNYEAIELGILITSIYLKIIIDHKLRKYKADILCTLSGIVGSI